MPSARDRFEFRFRWDKSEHQRFYRALQREVRRGSRIRWSLNAWFGFIAFVGLQGLFSARSSADIGPAVVPLAMVGGWLALDRWALAYLSTRSYERDHARCIPNDQVRVLDGDGITARCTTSNASVHWSGIVKIRETPDFFLFFTTPNCAIHLPKRAVADPDELRGWLNHAR